MKIRLSIAAAAAGALALAVVPAFGPAFGKDMVYGSYLPAKHNVNTHGLAPLFKALGPDVPWKLVTGGQLFSGKATLKSVGNRPTEAGLVIPAYVQGALKHAFISMDMMFAATDALVMNAAVMDTFINDCPECLADYKRAKTVLLSTYAIDGFVLHCRKPVTTLAAIRGKRVRTTGAMGRWAKALGGTPVAMTSGDMVEAINRGQLDCILGAMAWLKAYPIVDSIKSILTLNKGSATVSLFVMNRAAWNELSMSQKKAMIRAMPRTVANVMIDGYIGDYNKSLALAKEHGIAIHTPDAKLEPLFAKFQANENAAVVKKAAKRGAKDAQRIVDAINGNYRKWDKILAERERTDLKALSARYEKVLWERIYGKIDPAQL